MARLVATYADEINISSATPTDAAAAYARVDDACRAAQRDPKSVTRSAMVGVLVGRDESELRARVDDQLAMLGHGESDFDAERWLAERRKRWIMGTPDEARARVREFAAAGVQRIMLQDFLPRDLAMVRLLGEVLLALLVA